MIVGYIKRNNAWVWLVLIIGVVQALLNIGIIVTENLAQGDKIEWSFYIINEITGVFSGIILIPALFSFFKLFPLTKNNIILKASGYLLLSFVFGIVWTSIMYFVRFLLYPLFEIHRIHEIFNDLPYRYLMEYFKQFIIFCLLYYIHWNVLQFQKHQKRKKRELKLEGELLAAQLQSLQMQLQPHFFFNTLNTISSVMYKDPKKADQLISQMSDFLREVVHSKNTPLQSLENEIRFLKKYTDIMEARYVDKLKISFSLEKDSLAYAVPSLILQPIVENSIKYSIDHKDYTLVSIVSKILENNLIIEIRDNGPGLKISPIKKGTGLTVISQRLDAIYNSEYEFSITSPLESGTLVIISIPNKVRFHDL